MTKTFRDFVLSQQGVDVDKFSKYGPFGENYLQDSYNTIIQEGLIKSYPSDKVAQLIQSEFRNILKAAEIFPSSFILVPGDGTAENRTHHIKSDITRESDAKKAAHELNKLLKVYGWYVGKMNRTWSDTFAFNIEPEHVESEDNRNPEDGKFYHVTDAVSYKKIQKNGLNPRDSSTSYSHSGNRIYILQTPDPAEHLPAIATMLHDNKRGTARNAGMSQDRIDRWKPINQVYLEIDLPDDVKLYRDPMFPSTVEETGMAAFYITKSIHPDNIKEIDSDDFYTDM